MILILDDGCFQNTGYQEMIYLPNYFGCTFCRLSYPKYGLHMNCLIILVVDGENFELKNKYTKSYAHEKKKDSNILSSGGKSHKY